MCPLCCFTVFFTCLYVLTQYVCIVTTTYSTIFRDQRLCHSELASYVTVENYVTQFVDTSLSPVGMAFLQAGLRESRKTRSRSPYPRPLVRDNPEGRISSLSDRPNSIMEGQLDYAQHKFLASSMHSNVSSDFLGSDSLSGVSSRSSSLSVSEVSLFIYLFSTIM
jgi:hypothetical protein